MDEFADLDDLTLSQALDTYELDSLDIPYGTFTGVANWIMEQEESVPFETNVTLPAIPIDAVKDETFEADVKSDERFGQETTMEELIELQHEHESRHTRRNTKWAFKVYSEWMKSRATKLTPILECTDVELNDLLAYFVMEARRADGKPYPPRTLHNLCGAILRYMRENGVTDKNFLDVKDARFLNFRKTLDARMKQLSGEGIGVMVRQADPITPEQEVLLWDLKKLGKSTSQAMINTVFYYNCKLFGLRGYDEHRELESSQFTCGNSDGKTFIEFQGRTCKNFAGGLHQRNVTAKKIRHFSEAGHDRSVYDVYVEYLSLVGDGPMYRRPLSGETVRFGSQPIGKNTLAKIIKNMCSEAGIEGNFSNHSGKRTCATSLFQAGIDEQLIMGRTGHRSTAVRAYKRPCESQLQEVSRVLEPVSYVKGPSSATDSSTRVVDPFCDKENNPLGIPSYINIQNCQVNIINQK